MFSILMGTSHIVYLTALMLQDMLFYMNTDVDGYVSR